MPRLVSFVGTNGMGVKKSLSLTDLKSVHLRRYVQYVYCTVYCVYTRYLLEKAKQNKGLICRADSFSTRFVSWPAWKIVSKQQFVPVLVFNGSSNIVFLFLIVQPFVISCKIYFMTIIFWFFFVVYGFLNYFCFLQRFHFQFSVLFCPITFFTEFF